MQRWQRRHGRHDLPWQRTREPYAVWLSEVMLQQTQVATVLRYYERFLARFPDVRTLAAAPLDEVLAHWSGLGYYSRARHLHRAAQVVVERHGGAFPASAQALAELPGIGRSTAAAIAAFSFGERAAILDGNVKRVLARALGFGGDLAEPRAVAELWAKAEALLPRTGIERYTQGLMDLGATVCLTRAPRCDACPLAARCVAHAQGTPEAYPVKSRRTQRHVRRSAWLLVTRGGSVWLVQRPAQGIWARLWSLPELAQASDVRQTLGALPGAPQAHAPFIHRLTHVDWTLEPIEWRLPEGAADAADAELLRLWPDGRWWPREQALSLGVPAPLRVWLAEDRPPS